MFTKSSLTQRRKCIDFYSFSFHHFFPKNPFFSSPPQQSRENAKTNNDLVATRHRKQRCVQSHIGIRLGSVYLSYYYDTSPCRPVSLAAFYGRFSYKLLPSAVLNKRHSELFEFERMLSLQQKVHAYEWISRYLNSIFLQESTDTCLHRVSHTYKAKHQFPTSLSHVNLTSICQLIEIHGILIPC